MVSYSAVFYGQPVAALCIEKVSKRDVSQSYSCRQIDHIFSIILIMLPEIPLLLSSVSIYVSDRRLKVDTSQTIFKHAL